MIPDQNKSIDHIGQAQAVNFDVCLVFAAVCANAVSFVEQGHYSLRKDEFPKDYLGLVNW